MSGNRAPEASTASAVPLPQPTRVAGERRINNRAAARRWRPQKLANHAQARSETQLLKDIGPPMQEKERSVLRGYIRSI